MQHSQQEAVFGREAALSEGAPSSDRHLSRQVEAQLR